MEELEQKVVAPPAGQPEVPPDETGQGAGNATQPEGLTRDEVLKMVGEAEEKAFRRAQGLITKTNTRIRERVSELEQVLNKAGVTLDATQKAALELQVADQVATETTSEPAQGQPPEQPEEPPADPVTLIAHRMMKDAGVVIYEDDPEAKLIDTSDPYTFISSLPKAIEAKKAREASIKPNTPGIVGGGAPPSPYSGKRGLDLIVDHFEKTRV